MTGLDYATTFSLIEWLAVTGLVQCVFILVYTAFRARNWRQAAIAFSYFLCLAVAFGLQFSLRLTYVEQPLRVALWFFWAMGAPLCYLLVHQVVKLTEVPERKQLMVLFVMPAVFALSYILQHSRRLCEGSDWLCPRFLDILSWLGGMAGALCMLALWAQKDMFGKLWRQKGARERYWLVMTLVVANIMGVIVSLLSATGYLARADHDALHVILGIAFAYLATTTVFRVYPLPVAMSAASRARALLLTEEEKRIAEKVHKLMELDKVYHEHTFSRADLAREVGASENTLSRVINIAFGRSFPRLLNEFRVEDAKRMLMDPSIPIHVLASEVGFNSLASFNRVFRALTGETPSSYRAAHMTGTEKNP